MSDKPTKERILNAAENLMLENSYHSVGLNQILKAVNVPKGSFYHHFGSKEEFGVELLKYFHQRAHTKQSTFLRDQTEEANPLTRLHKYCQNQLGVFEANDKKCPCLIVKLVSEVVNSSDMMREVTAQCFEKSCSIFEEVFQEAIQKNLLPKETNIQLKAQCLHDLWFGALQRAMAQQSSAPLHSALTYTEANFLR